MTRRTVRVAQRLLDLIDEQLPAERGPGPSAADFIAVDLLEIVEVFATRWDTLVWHPDDPTGRVRLYMSGGRMVAHYAAAGVLAPDGSIDLRGITIDLAGLDDGTVPDDDPDD